MYWRKSKCIGEKVDMNQDINVYHDFENAVGKGRYGKLSQFQKQQSRY